MIQSNEVLTQKVKKLEEEIVEIRRLIGCPVAKEAMPPKNAIPKTYIEPALPAKGAALPPKSQALPAKQKTEATV